MPKQNRFAACSYTFSNHINSNVIARYMAGVVDWGCTHPWYLGFITQKLNLTHVYTNYLWQLINTFGRVDDNFYNDIRVTILESSIMLLKYGMIYKIKYFTNVRGYTSILESTSATLY